jgi:hypothetical protein
MPQEAALLAPRVDDIEFESVRPTSAGRVLIGLLVALGLYLGLRKLTTGWLLAWDIDPESWWLSFEGLQVVFGLQATASIFGSLLAASGRTRGCFLGAFVGGLCGVLFLAAEIGSGAPALDLVLLLQPALMLVVGAIAGVVGARIWPAAPEVEMPLPTDSSKLSSLKLVANRETFPTSRPLAWTRILAGAVIVILSMMYVEQVRFGAQKYSGGALHVSSQGQGKFLSWQLGSLAALVGGVLAGAGTGAGIRQGVFAGLLAGIALIGIAGVNGVNPVPVDYWLGRLELKGLGPLHPGTMAGVLGGCVMIGAIGGWLGGTLFLPLAPAYMRNQRLKLGGD